MTFKLNKTRNYYVSKSKIKNLSEFVEAVDKAETLIDDNESADVWFRGHAKTSYKLIPSIFRNNSSYNPSNESDEVTQFIHKARAFLNGGREHESMWD
jgi:hypothetical protein